MKIQVEEIGPVKKRVEVSVPEDRVALVHKKLLREFNRSAKIHGFRPGKIPSSILERYYGQSIKTEMTSLLVSETLEDVLNSQGIEAVGQPTLENSERISENGFGFRYAISVEVMPHLEPKDYLGLHVERPEWEIPPERIDAELTWLQDQHALLQTRDEERPIQKGDLVIIDIEGKVEGRTFDEGRSENLLVEVGSGKLLPSLEEGLIGLYPHSTGEITISFPEDFKQSQLTGKTAVFSVNVKELKQKILPPLDDEFAREVGEFNTLQELRDKIRKDLQHEAERVSDEALNEEILDQLRTIHPVDLPHSMVEKEGRQIFKNLKERLASQGANAEIKVVSDQEIMARCFNEALKHVHSRLILQSIAKKEGLIVTDEEMNQEILRLARQSDTAAERIKKELQENRTMEALRSRVLEDKTLDFLREKATIKIEKKLLASESKS